MEEINAEIAEARKERREKAARIQESIREILFNDWDPIGVNDLAPNDEYDAYVGGVYRLLVSGAADAELSEHLRQLEITQMESPTNPEHRKMVVRKLRALGVSS